jgi:hypothetical protein
MPEAMHILKIRLRFLKWSRCNTILARIILWINWLSGEEVKTLHEEYN